MKRYRTVLTCLLCLAVAPDSLRAGTESVILNSNASVKRYQVVQTEFEKTIDRPIAKIDLGDPKLEIGKVESFLKKESPDLIYCIGSKAYLTANRFMNNKNIVFSSVLNWMRLPLTEKTYGVASELHVKMQIIMYKYIFPDIRKIGVLYTEKYTLQWFENAVGEARKVGVQIIGQKIENKSEAVPALRNILETSEAVWLISDPVIIAGKEQLMAMVRECDSKKVPIFSNFEEFKTIGVVLMVSVDDPTIGRQAATMALNVLAGEPLEENVQYPAGSRITLNLGKVNEFKLKYNESALGAVNEIIK